MNIISTCIRIPWFNRWRKTRKKESFNKTKFILKMSSSKTTANSEKDETRYYDEVFQRLKNSINNKNNGDLDAESEIGKFLLNQILGKSY